MSKILIKKGENEMKSKINDLNAIILACSASEDEKVLMLDALLEIEQKRRQIEIMIEDFQDRNQ
jgi:DNA polymerase III delta prime subunit